MFVFLQNNIENWAKNHQEINDLITKWGASKRDFTVEVKEYSHKTPKQNRAYWKLITIYQQFINSFGNDFTTEEVSDWVKIKAGHFIEIDGVLTPRSIKNDRCSKSQIKVLIDWIIARGINRNIKGLNLTTSEYDELLNNYK